MLNEIKRAMEFERIGLGIKRIESEHEDIRARLERIRREINELKNELNLR